MDFSALGLPLVTFPAVAVIVLVTINVLRGDQTKRLKRMTTYGQYGQQVLESIDAPTSNIIKQRDFSRIGIVQSILSASTFADRLQTDLIQAGIPLRVGEYFAVRIVVGVVLTLPVLALGLPTLAMIPLGVGGFFLPELYLKRLQGQRLQKFNDSLVDALSLMANAMKSGSSFLQALDLVAHELPAPLGDEFGRIVTEISVGTPVEEAMSSLAKRVPSYDLYLMVTAVLIQRETGGNLAEILNGISFTIRDRIRLLRQVQTLTASESMGAVLVGSLPVVMLIGFTLLSPAYTAPLFSELIGRVILAGAVALEIVGFVVMKAVSKIEV